MEKNVEENIISLIFSLGRLVREHSAGEKPDVPSFIHLEMMKRVGDTDGMTMKDLASFLCIRAPSVTYLIEDLAKNGYVKRKNNLDDLREVKIVLTPKGGKILKTLYPKRMNGFREVLGQLRDQEQKKFADLLEKIHKIYKQKNK